MANFVLSYDLNGSFPTHKEMDAHLAKLGTARARLLETVWYVSFSGNAAQLRDYVKQIIGPEDLLLVVEATNAAWTKLLVDNQWLIERWTKAAA